MGAKPLKLLKSKILLLSLIVLLGLVLRVYKLDSNPPGLTWDEASLGYNAYSIATTGRDEYGQILPLTLKSFGDYKPAIYAYLIIPFLPFFGLSEWSVRLPSALAGTAQIVVVFFLIKALFKNSWLGLACAFCLAISPFSIQFSRAGFESNASVLFNETGVLFFLMGIKKPKFFFLSVIFLISALVTYQASKIFTPILIFGLYLIYLKQIKYNKEFIISSALLFLSVFSILFITLFLGQGKRLETVNFFAYNRSDEEINQILKEDNLDKNSLEFEVLHGEWFAYARGLAERYLIYFSPKMLFIDGDYSPRHSVPDLGILNIISLIFIIAGVIYFVKLDDSKKIIIFFWLLAAPIPAVLSRDLISMLRAERLVVPFALFEGAGVFLILSRLSKLPKKISYLSYLIVFVLIFGNYLIYLDSYYVHFPKENSEGWLYGYKQVMQLNLDFSKYDKVIFSDKYGQPYIYYLFYSKYPPQKYQTQAKLEQTTVDVGSVKGLDNIEFRPIYWPADRGSKNTLFIGDEFTLPEADVLDEKKAKKITDINFLDGKNAFRVVENSN